MEAEKLFYIIITILVVEHLLDEWLSFLNAKNFKAPIPKELADVYDEQLYQKSQEYKLANERVSNWASWLSFLVTLVFLLVGGFSYVDNFARQLSDNQIVMSLIFFGILSLASSLLSLPFAYYGTFVIEEKFGFNKMTRKLFFIDLVKSLLLSAVLGGVILALVVWFYEQTKSDFWLYTWLLISGFSLLMAFLYTRIIVPIFNKQTPLEDGELKEKIEQYAQKVGFKLKNIFVIDGSKRSTKANAYFSGFGKTKQITLYDTLIKDLTPDEIVAVLAHEVGHYKRNHIIFNMLLSILLTGITLYILSLAIENPLFSQALGVQEHSFHVGLVAFALLYSPISTITDLLMNMLSRKFEYQADNYAKETTNTPEHLVNALKKLSRNSLSNLTPHHLYVFFNYSHPTLYQRVINLLQK